MTRVPDDMASVRAQFARVLRVAAALPPGPAAERVADAFAAVPRERHAGPGPWRLLPESPRSGAWTTPNDDPRWLYTDALVTLDEGASINIGSPSMWASMLGALDVPVGAHVMQVGAGTGYYTAVLAHLAGPRGRVDAREIEPVLAERSVRALEGVAGVNVAQGNAATDPPPGPHEFIVAFAGVTHPVPAWIEALAPGGRMLLPVTGASGWGALVLFERDGEDRMTLGTLGRCGFYPCAGARDDALAALWDERLTPQRSRGAMLVMERRAAGPDEVALPGGWALVG